MSDKKYMLIFLGIQLYILSTKIKMFYDDIGKSNKMHIQYDIRQISLDLIQNTINNDDLSTILNKYKISQITPSTFKTKLKTLKICVNRVPLFHSSNTNNNYAAFVVKDVSWAVFTNKKTWNSYQTHEKIRALIHECTHLQLQTNDFAYLHERKFNSLRGFKALNNADTITKIIFHSLKV